MAIETEVTADVPEGFKPTEIGLLPEVWQVLALEHVVARIDSGDWGDEKPGAGTAAARVLRGTDFAPVRDGRLDQVPVRYLGIRSLDKRALVHGDLLVELSGGSKDQPTGRILLVTESLEASSDLPLVFSNFVKRLRLGPVCDPEFLRGYWEFLYSRGITRVYEKRTTGIRNFKLAEFLANESVGLPPLDEQRTIAKVLSTIQRAIETTERVIAAARQLKRSLMRHLFTYGPVPLAEAERVPLKETDIDPLPEHWQVVHLEQCARVQTGVAKGRKFRVHDQVISVPYLRVANVQSGYLDLAEIKDISIRASELPRYSLQPEDVVVTEGGDLDKLGRGFIWHGQIPMCVHQNHIFAVRAHRELVCPEYLAYLIQSEYGRKYFLTVAHRTTHLACINTAKLRALPVPVPPLPEQQEIIGTLQKVDAKIEAEEKRRAALKDLFRTMLHLIMTGQLRVKDCQPLETKEVA